MSPSTLPRDLPIRIALLTSGVRTLERLAALTGIERTRVSRIVNGWLTPTARERQAIAHALSTAPGELFKW